MRIFVSGVAGFLGSHLAERLLSLGHEVVGCDSLIGGELCNVPADVIFHQMDCRDFNAMLRITAGCELVYHCAATAYEGLSVFSPALVVDNIVSGSTALFSAAIANRVQRIVFCSSMARYGDQPCPFTEDMTPRPKDPYGIAKVAAEDILRNLCEVHGVDWVIAVPHNIIGPRQKFDDPYRNVVSIMANLMLQGRPPIIYGDGEQKRCFSFIEDCLSCLVSMGLEAACSRQIINIGPDEEFVTIRYVAKVLKALTNFDGEPVHVPPRPQEVKFATCSADKARRLLDYRTTTALTDGLASVVDHIRKVGPKRFRYHLDLEIRTELTPRTWAERLF